MPIRNKFEVSGGNCPLSSWSYNGLGEEWSITPPPRSSQQRHHVTPICVNVSNNNSSGSILKKLINMDFFNERNELYADVLVEPISESEGHENYNIARYHLLVQLGFSFMPYSH